MRRWLLLAALAATRAFDAFGPPPDSDPYDEEDDDDDYLDGGARDDDPFGYNEDSNCEGRAVYNVLAKRNFCVVNGTWADEFSRRVEGFTVGWEPQTRALIHAHLARSSAVGQGCFGTTHDADTIQKFSTAAKAYLELALGHKRASPMAQISRE